MGNQLERMIFGAFITVMSALCLAWALGVIAHALVLAAVGGWHFLGD